MRVLTFLFVIYSFFVSPDVSAQGATISATISQNFGGLRAIPVGLEVGSMQIRLVFRLDNITHEQGGGRDVAVALALKPGYQEGYGIKAQLGGNPEINFIDNPEIYGISFGRNANEWLVIPPGGSSQVSFLFAASIPGRPGAPLIGPFNFNAEFMTYRQDRRQREIHYVHFPSLGQR